MELEIWKEVFSAREETERHLRWKHPGFDVYYNWLIGILIIALMWATFIWALQIYTNQKAESIATAAIAEQQAAQEAEAAAAKQSEDYILSQEATEVAKALYGIHLFIDKYGYSEKDLITYVRCMTNRAEASGCSLQEVIRTEGQFLGYYEKNAVLDEFYDLALRLVTAWHSETTKPCDVSYQFAELQPDGIYLRNRFEADGYARRWQA